MKGKEAHIYSPLEHLFIFGYGVEVEALVEAGCLPCLDVESSHDGRKAYFV